MLCITRKVDEEVVIECDGKRVSLVIQEIRSGKVSLRFHGHPEIYILRKEIDDRIQGELQR